MKQYNYERVQQAAADHIALYARAIETEIVYFEGETIAGMELNGQDWQQALAISQEIREVAGQSLGEIDKQIDGIYERTAREITKEGDNRAAVAGIAAGALWANEQAKQLYYVYTDRAKTMTHRVILTTAPQTERKFHEVLQEAFELTRQGMGHDKAKVYAIQKLAKYGVRYVDYSSGRRDHVDVAIRRATVSSLNQYHANIAMERYKELGAEIVETSAHNGARDSHAVWQGQRFSLHGAVTIEGTRYSDFYDATDYGSITGLMGINCRHSFYPVFNPESVPPAYSEADLAEINNKHVMYDGKSRPQYEAQQLHRKQEREIRETKRQIQGIIGARSVADSDVLKEQETILRKMLAEQNEEYRANAKAAGFRLYPERLRIQLF